MAFFPVEIGDKTQLATVALTAQFNAVVLVALGTTVGMMIVDAPVVWFGATATNRLPLRAVRLVASMLFALTGLAIPLTLDIAMFG